MHKRTLLLAAAVGGVILAALWRHSIRSPAPTSDASWTNTLPRSGTIAHANPPASQDTLSEAEALRRVERLYRYQADLMQAQAAHDPKRVEAILNTAIDELGTLVERPGLVQRPRFRRVFQALTSEYEARYGAPDTLRLPQGDIYDMRSGLFASLNQDAPVSLVDELPSDLREQDLPVPLTLNRPVRESMTFLLQHKQRYLYPWLRRASTYFPMIEQIFAEEGVPDELKYLAIAESGLNPHAQSRAKAAGIWQFVAQTGRRYGLAVDPWVDERLDPEKATRAAARHLKDLHARFGDWQLALAGYNCDPGVVQYHAYKYRQRTGQAPSFWDIYQELPEETRNYVPLFTATAIILSNPADFDLKRVEAGPRYAFDYVPVDAALTVKQVARLAGAEPSKVRALNPELRSNRLPPSEDPYYVRLPYGTYHTFAENYAALPDEERDPTLKHVLQSGETMGQVAQRYHVERSRLVDANTDGYPITMQVGQRLTIPASKYAGNARIAESADAEPIRVRYGSRTIRSIGTGGSLEESLTASVSDSSAPAP
jgi:membrane-bound lytic murein transglycosylase D